MALILERKCFECGETKRENVNHVSWLNNTCIACFAKKKDREKRQFLAGLKGLTLEERISRIEEDLYNLNADVRLVNLEARHIRY